MSSALFSEDKRYRYRLDRDVDETKQLVFAYFGVNPSIAGADVDDQTVRKWNGFTLRNHGRRYIVGNAFAAIATDVNALAGYPDPVGPSNNFVLRSIIAEADILVPCWGSKDKLPRNLRWRLLDVLQMLRESSKPIKVLGFTNKGDPLHPLMLAYDTPLLEWRA